MNALQDVLSILTTGVFDRRCSGLLEPQGWVLRLHAIY
jgi:hypothetical protein